LVSFLCGPTADPLRSTCSVSASASPARYQSSHRLTWLKIHAFLSGSVPASDLPTLNAVDAAVIAHSFDVA
jgi:hypothetical protein